MQDKKKSGYFSLSQQINPYKRRNRHFAWQQVQMTNFPATSRRASCALSKTFPKLSSVSPQNKI